jgi:hypothetical protein
MDPLFLQRMDLRASYQIELTRYSKDGDKPGQSYHLVDIFIVLKALHGNREEIIANYKTFIERQTKAGQEEAGPPKIEASDRNLSNKGESGKKEAAGGER